jgi:hypothetical protein
MNGGIIMFNSNCSTALTMPVAPVGYGYGYGNGGGMFGNDSDLLALIILFALFGGNGFGFGGFGGNRDCATQADVRAAVDQQTLISKLDQQTYGLADSTYALNNAITSGFNGVQATLCQGFNGVDRAIADCCCTTQRAIDGVNYNMATQACDIKHAINDSTRSILDFLTTDKIASLQAENQNLKLKASQAEQNAYITANQQAQTAELIRRLGADCPVNAYVVQPPTPVTFPTNCCGQFAGFGYGGYGNSGCGCGCA